jgi:carotenoid 1,2-hydratase
MTERGEASSNTSEKEFNVGPSSLKWDGSCLTINFDEFTIPHMDRLRGTVKIFTENITNIEVPLTNDETHIWRPFSPNSRIEVKVQKPGWDWSGHGYFDANFGTSALEKDFSYWTWGRFPTKGGTTAFYDAIPRQGPPLNLGLKFKDNGEIEELNNPPPKSKLSRSLWTVRRETRSDLDFKPKQVKYMLDTPFYTRSAIETKIFGEKVVGVHEALDLNRFASPFLKPFLAVKAPRRKNWTG